MTEEATMSSSHFILHAGTTELLDINIVRQNAIHDVLSSVANTARASLRAGARATDVVEAAVATLEQCSYFNAGKGSVLTADNTHEARTICNFI